MCGIVGCILKNNEDVAPILFDCISKLEYRGYDSIGLMMEIFMLKKIREKSMRLTRNWICLICRVILVLPM